MSTTPKRKVTYSLPEDLIEDIACVVREGAAPSYSAFVEEALTEKVRTAREEALAAATSPDPYYALPYSVRWPEQTLPGYIETHVHRRHLDRSKGEYCLVPTFRLPTLIHTRSANAKWLYEISHKNPVWMHPSDANRLGVETGDLECGRVGIFRHLDQNVGGLDLLRFAKKVRIIVIK